MDGPRCFGGRGGALWPGDGPAQAAHHDSRSGAIAELVLGSSGSERRESVSNGPLAIRADHDAGRSGGDHRAFVREGRRPEPAACGSGGGSLRGGYCPSGLREGDRSPPEALDMPGERYEREAANIPLLLSATRAD